MPGNTLWSARRDCVYYLVGGRARLPFPGREVEHQTL